MFGIELRKKDNIKNRENHEKERKKEIKKDDKSKYYVEINPDTEIVRVESKEQLKALGSLEESKALEEIEKIKALPSDELPPLKKDQVCAHWERELIFLSEINFNLYHKIKMDMIIGGYCPDCGASLGRPKLDWYPKTSYKKK